MLGAPPAEIARADGNAEYLRLDFAVLRHPRDAMVSLMWKRTHVDLEKLEPESTEVGGLAGRLHPHDDAADVRTGRVRAGVQMNATTGDGYCTSACVVGGSVPCPNGWVCDDNQLTTLPDGTALQVENARTSGFCVAPCSLVGGSGACPTNSTCQLATPAGPDCLP